MSVHDLRKYGRSKFIEKDLGEVLRIINDFQRKLYPFTKYQYVNDLMFELEQIRLGLEIFYHEYRDVLENKGKIDE